MHPLEEFRSGVGRLDVEGRRGDALFDRPVDSSPEDIAIVAVHAEDEAAVDHDAEVMQTARDLRVVAAEILPLVALFEIRREERFEADKQAAQAGSRRVLDQVSIENRIDGGSALEQTVHPPHAVEERAGEPAIAEQMIVEEIEMTARQPRDFRQRVIDTLRVETTPAGKKRVLVAEV